MRELFVIYLREMSHIVHAKYLRNYEKFMKEGCQFLQLNPPKNIWEATNHLLIFYRHVPSITTMPVYIGNIDYLLEPFITDEEEAKLFVYSSHN